ncbi:MAG: response regulator [Candidatus Scalindua sp.]|nr:response regulator [Candidatus Scalindua sp.]MDV5165227.1 response regulator [Candidatus Scalindua sp.]
MKEKKIVLIEDNPDHAELIAEAIGDGDTESNSILLSNGMEAIDYFEGCSIEDQIENRIRLIVIDLKLAKIGGIDILKFLKKNSRYSKIPVIIFSATSDQETINEAYKNGANGYFVKPVDHKEFIEKIKILKKCC